MGKVLWFTGLSGSGKTTIALELKKTLQDKGNSVIIFDGDIVRKTLHKNLGFSRIDIKENNRLIAELAKQHLNNYDYILVPIISPYIEDRSMARFILKENFYELYVSTSLQDCIKRDVKGLYKKALAGEIKNFIGISKSNPYEPPQNPEIKINTKEFDVNKNVKQILDQLNFDPEIYFSSDTKLAIAAAIEAGKVCLNIYNGEFKTVLKDDNSPLTKADLESDKILHRFLSNYPILSEESTDDITRLNHSKIWIIDPIDGTADFVNKTGEFSVMVGLVEDNEAVIGIVFQPSEDTLFVAEKGKGCYMKKSNRWSRINVTSNYFLKSSRAICSRNHLTSHEREFLKHLQITKFKQYGSAGLKVAEICRGEAELYFTTTNKIKQWDTCAAYCLIKEAGGMITDMYGNELRYNTSLLNHENGIMVTNGHLHDTILQQFRNFLESRII